MQFLLILLLIIPLKLSAIAPSEQLQDPNLEARAREISANLRCLVCQNQTIDDSGAQIAKTLRIIVRERLLLGESNQAITDYIVSKYGNFVLMKPPFYLATYFLWFSPLIILILGFLLIRRFYRAPVSESPEISQTDLEKIQQSLHNERQSS